MSARGGQGWSRMQRRVHVQLPGAVAQLGSSLADVKVANLSRAMLAVVESGCGHVQTGARGARGGRG